MRVVLSTFLVSVGYIVGLYFYCRGFLLSRQTLLLNSTCSEVQHPNPYQNSDHSGCWTEARYRRVIVLLIDALRYDFVRPQPIENANIFYHNKLFTIERLLREESDKSLLYEFTADPPTTTLQRLKALTTGSLPTFIDAGSNFAGYAIEEDNLIDQLVKRNHNITLLGDDTWLSLFPAQLQRHFAFPSFDVKDLHTVDNGILAHLYGEINRPDWSVLVAHFLGVDHCGHKYGPTHSAMTDKLSQMDAVIRNVTELMDDRTLLLVLGDHGMTETGDHGGDSPNELSAAAFFYSKNVLHSSSQNIKSAVAQVDLVPTLSLLLDVPIPFSNLGCVMMDLFIENDQRTQAAKANVWQVVRYAENYAKSSGDFALKERLEPHLKIIYSLSPDELTIDRSVQFVRQLQGIFRDCWAKFHIGWMTLGLLSLVESVLWSLRLLIQRRLFLGGRRALLKLLSLFIAAAAIFGHHESIPRLLGVLVSLQVIMDLHGLAYVLLDIERRRQPSASSIICVLLLLVHAASALSNSFIVYEHQTTAYLLQTFILLVLLCRPSTTSTQTKSKFKSKNFRSVIQTRFGAKTLCFGFLSLCLVRFSGFFVRCREEQSNCEQSWAVLSFASLPEDSSVKQVRFLLAVCSLFALGFGHRWFLRRNGHLDGNSFSCWTATLCGPICTLLVAVYWISFWLPETLLKRFTVVLERIPALSAYALLSVTFLVLFWRPVLVSLVDVRERVTEQLSDSSVLLNQRRIYQHFKNNWAHYLCNEQHLCAFGLASAYSGVFVLLLSCLTLYLVMVLGDGMAPSVLVFIVLITLILELSANSRRIMVICTFSMLASHYFYAFGHQPTFTAIPWEAAFVGIPGNFRFQFVQAAMVLANIFASHILVAACAPLIFLWPFYANKLGPLNLRQGSDGTEHSLLNDRSRTSFSVWSVCLTYLLLLALKLLSVTVASAIHRRHLMVWKIFAPKFIFEGSSFIVSCIAVLVANFVVWRIHSVMPDFRVQKAAKINH